MRKIAIVLAVLLAPSLAFAQAQLKSGHVWGNAGASEAPGSDAAVTSILDRAFGATRGGVIERGASGWAIVGPGSTSGLPWVSNGAGADPAYQRLGFSDLSGSATLGQLPQGIANSIWINPTGSTAAMQNVAVPACANDGSHALVYVNNTGLQCASLTTIGVTSLNGQTGAVALGALTPQVRVTLVSGQAVMTSSQAGANTVYVTPYGGCMVPIYDGTNMVPTCFAEVSQLTTDATKSPVSVGTSSIYDIFCWIDSGTNRCTRGPAWTSDTARSAGTALVLVNGIWLNNASITNGPAASRGTYVGSIRSDGSSLINYVFGAVANPCTGANFAVFSAYNRVPVSTMLGEAVSSWTYAVSGTWREINGTSSCVISQLRGLNEDSINIKYYAVGLPGAATNAANGIGIDSTTAFSGTTGFLGSGTSAVQQATAAYSGMPGLGYHTYAAIEFNSTATASTWDGTAGIAYLQTGLHGELWQ